MNTEITTVTYRFSRDENSPNGFLLSQRPSTAAIGAIEKWTGEGRGRSYVVVDDQDDSLVAKLMLQIVDIDKAACNFNALCAQLGVKYEVVPS